MTIAPADTANGSALSLHGIAQRFGRTMAVDDASLDVRRGTVHALLGENGAGKTTLMRVAFGMQHPDRGTIRVRGREVTLSSPTVALAHGIGMVHQHFTLVPAMTVAENVALGGRGIFDPRATATRVREIAARTGLSMDPDARVDTLPVGAQQRCEIVKALARDVDVLILDEPTSVLTPEEAGELLRWTRAFADAGHAVVLITHKLRDALAVADDVTVLRNGRVTLAARTGDIDERRLVDAMLGAEDRSARADVTGTVRPGAVVVRAEAVVVRDERGVVRVRGADMVVHAGEIVGIAGVEGAGQHELLRAIAGRSPVHGGRLELPAVIGFIPEDRNRDALMPDEDLVSNVALRDAGSRRGSMDWTALDKRTRHVMREFDVRGGEADEPVTSLSGGNQQKLVLGRELTDAPPLLVAENPTRGLDFNATESILHALLAARRAGTAIVLHSTDLDEVLALADRVYVMRDGVLSPSVHDREVVGHAMLAQP